ncbi:MAG: hypothetical protein PVG85_04345 [Deltaproteobacteria bacterium]|jgi:hypothetical protein
MKDKHHKKQIDMLIQDNENHWGEDYVWATSRESKRHALSLSLVGSIVHQHGGTVQIDSETHSINIDVPEEEKLRCAEELSRKVDMTLH